MAISPELARKFEQRLRRHERDLERTTLSAVSEGRQVAVTDSIDPADQAVLSYQKEMLFHQGTHGRSQLNLVRLALNRIAEGTFGDCLLCEQAIGAKRLEALPWTPYCIDCQEKIEAGEVEDPVQAA